MPARCPGAGASVVSLTGGTLPAAGANVFSFGNNHRLDREWNIRVGASYAFAKNWSLNPSLTITENKSSWAVNTFRRTLSMATVRYDFR